MVNVCARITIDVGVGGGAEDVVFSEVFRCVCSSSRAVHHARKHNF